MTAIIHSFVHSLIPHTRHYWRDVCVHVRAHKYVHTHVCACMHMSACAGALCMCLSSLHVHMCTARGQDCTDG